MLSLILSSVIMASAIIVIGAVFNQIMTERQRHEDYVNQTRKYRYDRR